MMKQRNYLVWSVILLAVGGVLAGCGTGGGGGTATPAGPPGPAPGATGGPRIVPVGEGVLAARPDPRQAPGSLQVHGRLLRPAADADPVLQTFYLSDPPGRPVESRLALRDPGNLLPPATAGVPGPLVSLDGVFTPTTATTGGIDIGMLEVAQATPLALDERALTQAADASLQAQATQLAALDYPRLALADFATPTARWQPRAADFQAGGSTFYGLAADGTPITEWRGPALPAHPARPLVTRWPAIYALFQDATVDTLLVTIVGQVAE